MRSLTTLRAFAPLLLVLALSSVSLSAERAGSEQLLPERTLAFAKIPSAREFRSKWGNSSFGAVQNDPAFRDFVADIERQISEMTVGVEKSFGVGLKELWNSLQGEVSLGLVHLPGEGFAVVAIADVAESDDSAAALVELLNARLSASGGVEATMQAGSHEITSWSTGTGADARKFSYFRNGGRLVVSNNLGALLGVANRSNSGSSETFAGNKAYQHIVKQSQPDKGTAALTWYVDPVGLLEAGVSDNLRGNPNSPTVLGLLPEAGLDKFKAFGGSFEMGSGGVDSVTQTVGYVDGPAGGLLEAFKLPATTQTPPAWVKDDVNLYGQINFSVADMYRTVATFFDKTQGAGSFEQSIGSTKIGNSQYTYQEVVDQLVGPLHIVAQVPSSVEEVVMQPSVIAFGVRDSQKMSEMLNELAAEGGLKSTVVDGVTLFSKELDTPAEGQKIDIGVAVADGAMMLSTSGDYLKSVLAGRNSKRPLAESLAYKQATQNFPQQTAMISFQRQDGRFEGLYEQLRAGKMKLPLYGGLVSGLGFDFSKLPPFSAMSRYMQTSSSYIEPIENGFRITSVGQQPRER